MALDWSSILSGSLSNSSGGTRSPVLLGQSAERGVGRRAMSNQENSRALTSIDHLFETAHSLRRAGAIDAALPLLQKALEECRNLNVTDRKREARILDELGCVSFWRGQHAEAEDYFKRALSLLEAETYPEHPILAHPLHHLAHLYIAMDRFDKAEEYAQKALAIRQSSRLAADSSTVENMRMCAIVELELGRLEAAEDLLKKAIAILEPSTIGPFEEFVYLLADVYQMQGKNDEAEAYYKRALMTFQHRLGRPARHAACMSDYAKFLRQLGRVRDAEKLEAGIPTLMEAYQLEESIGTHELDRDLPDTDVYQCLMYPATIFH